jgi:hypothetical protein
VSGGLDKAGEAVENQTAGDGNVEAGATADHRDLDAGIGGIDVLGGDALGLMAQQHDRWNGGGRQPVERDRVVGELNGEDLPSTLALETNPAVLAGSDPMNAAPPRELARVADGERVAVVLGVRNGHARAGGVTGAQQGAEVGLVGNPQRGDDEMPPTPVSARTASTPNIPRALLSRGHASWADRPCRE